MSSSAVIRQDDGHPGVGSSILIMRILRMIILVMIIQMMVIQKMVILMMVIQKMVILMMCHPIKIE